MYRLFIDEFGHDNLNTRNDPKEQFLSLTGVVLDLDGAHPRLTEQMNSLKMAAFGSNAVVLHRREIINKKPPPFDALANDEIREAFTQGLLKMVNDDVMAEWRGKKPNMKLVS